MAEISFYITDEDFGRLYELKSQEGKDNLTGNDFAKELFLNELYRLHPEEAQDGE